MRLLFHRFSEATDLIKKYQKYSTKHTYKGPLEMLYKDDKVIAYYDERKDMTMINTDFIKDSINININNISYRIISVYYNI